MSSHSIRVPQDVGELSTRTPDPRDQRPKGRATTIPAAGHYADMLTQLRRARGAARRSDRFSPCCIAEKP